MRSRIALACAGLAVLCGHAYGQESCTPIRFASGRTSATIRGIASSESPACYALTTRAGQTASVNIMPQSRNDDTAFSIEGVIDDRDRYSFRTQAATYKILVFLTFARQPPRPFAMQVSVR